MIRRAPLKVSQSLHRLLDVIAFQYEVTGAGWDPPTTMRMATEHAELITGADGAIIELAEGDEMVYRVVSGSASASLGLRLSVRGSLSGLATTTGEVQSCTDSEEDPRVDREACRRVGLRSMLCVPLLHRQSCVGVLKVISARIAAFDETDAAVLHLLGGVIASTMTQAKLVADLEQLASTDPLTSLPNRRGFEVMAGQCLALARRFRTSLSLAMIDLDHFKRYNDTYGHSAGDALLSHAARRWSRCLRGGDVLARWGGEEFVLLLADCDRDQAVEVCNRLRAATPDRQTFSAGLALGHGGACIADLIALADQALYEAKARGRNRTAIASDQEG